MQVGVQLPEVERPVAWPELRQMALTAEAVGFDSLWVGDHLLYRTRRGTVGPWEAWSLLAALAAVTERVTLGPLVAATSFHNPAMLAKKAATVDEIARGRLVLGLGAGWNRDEYEAFGFPYDRRVDRFEEAFTIVRRLLDGEEFDFRGRFHTLGGSVLAPPPSRPIPLLIGSNGRRMLTIALPHAAMWNTWYASYGNTAAGLVPLLGLVDEVCRAVGRDPGTLQRTAAVLVQLPGGVGRETSSERPPVEPLTGSAPQLAEQLAAFADAGIDHVQLVLDPIDIASIEAMAEVVGLLRAAGR